MKINNRDFEIIKISEILRMVTDSNFCMQTFFKLQFFNK